MPAQPILAVSGNETELESLRWILYGSSWRVQTAHTLAEAVDWLKRNETAVVLCAPSLEDGDWRQMLLATADLPQPPAIVVMSTTADDRFWLDVLEGGGYDLLQLPADRAELFRILTLAWRTRKTRTAMCGTGGAGLGALSLRTEGQGEGESAALADVAL